MTTVIIITIVINVLLFISNLFLSISKVQINTSIKNWLQDRNISMRARWSIYFVIVIISIILTVLLVIVNNISNATTYSNQFKIISGLVLIIFGVLLLIDTILIWGFMSSLTKRVKIVLSILLGISLVAIICGISLYISCQNCTPIPPLKTPSPTLITITPTHSLTDTPTIGSTDTPTLTPTITSTSTPTPTPTSTYIPTQVIQKIADYFDCINTNSGEKLNGCWDLLSSRSGEYQDNYPGGLSGFHVSWDNTVVGYRLFYCYDKTVLAEISLFERNDRNTRVDFGTPSYARYRLAKDSDGWRIAQKYTQQDLGEFNDWLAISGENRITDINSNCDSYLPIIQKTPAP